MEGEESVGMMLSRVAEIQCKITACIHKVTANGEEERGDDVFGRLEGLPSAEREDEAESLFGIRDALDSLQEQLSSLQALQQQQQYERESAIAEIDYSRRNLLKKLNAYKGENLEVIHEASAFAGGTVEIESDLLLPPYQTHAPESMISKFMYHHLEGETKLNGSEKLTQKGCSTDEKKTPSRIKMALGLAAKTVLTLVGVVSVLSLAGFEPKISRKSFGLKFFGRLPRPSQVEENTMPIQCPPGKVLMMEDGVPRCIVKERVEVPFGSMVNLPHVSYGFG